MSDSIATIGASTSAASAAERMPIQKLDQDDFIKILVAQLTSQDPLNPQKDTEFVAQMAQFSALESTKAMQAEIQTLRANSLLGQMVEVSVKDGLSVVGEVTAVDIQRTGPKIIIGDMPYALSEVLRVERPGVAGTTTETR